MAIQFFPAIEIGMGTKTNVLILENFKKKWKLERTKNAKLQDYSRLHGTFKIKNYLLNFDIRKRDILSRLISGSNSLSVDTVRERNIPRKNRTCLLCWLETENLKHFLTRYPMLRDIRMEAFNSLEKFIISLNNKYLLIVWKNNKIRILLGSINNYPLNNRVC